MIWLKRTARFVGLFVGLSAVFVALGWLIGKQELYVAAPVMAVSIFFVVGSFSEQIVKRILKAEPLRQGVLESLRAANLSSLKGRIAPDAEIYCFSSSSPDVLLVRSLGAKGTILFSHTALAQLNESEFRAILLAAAARIRAVDLSLTSICATLPLIFFRKKWWKSYVAQTDLEKNQAPTRASSPLQFLMSLALESWVKTFLFLGGSASKLSQASTDNAHFQNALHKLTDGKRRWNISAHPAIEALSIIE